MEMNLIQPGITKGKRGVNPTTTNHQVAIPTSNSSFSTGYQKTSARFDFKVGGIFEFSTYQQP